MRARSPVKLLLEARHGAPRRVVDTISDFAANAGTVLGGQPVVPMVFDLRWVGAILFVTGRIEQSSLASAALNPAHRRRGGRQLPDR